MPKVLIKRGTRAQLDAAAASGQLAANELYYITDDDRLLIGTGTSTWSDLSKQVARVVYRGTWAGRPTSGLSSGDLAWMEDIGVGGALMHWNASTGAWRATSPIILYARHGSFTSPLATLTGVTSSAFAIPGGAGKGIRIPAGLLAGGAVCEVRAIARRTTAVASCQFTGWINKVDAFGGGSVNFATISVATTENRQYRYLNEFALSDGGLVTRDNWLAPGSQKTGAASDVTTSFTNADETYVGIGVQSANVADVFELISFSATVK